MILADSLKEEKKNKIVKSFQKEADILKQTNHLNVLKLIAAYFVKLQKNAYKNTKKCLF